jgi:hypothetical protein
MDVVLQEFFNNEDEKIKLDVAASCLHVMEYDSAAEDIGCLAYCTTTNYDVVVRKIIALKVGKPAL